MNDQMNEMKICEVLSHLTHDGAAYEPGAAAALPEDTAERLAAAGVVRIAPPAAAPKPASRADSIAAAIDRLAPASKPSVKALEAAAGLDISAAERDAAWAAWRDGA